MRNPVISCYRIAAIFLVVLAHCRWYNRFMEFHVPLFLAIAFYFFSKKMPAFDLWGMLKRLKRILIPFCLWGIVYVLLFHRDRPLWDAMWWQLTVGGPVAPHLYYLVVLSACTVVIGCVALTRERYRAWLLLSLALGCLVWRATGLNNAVVTSLRSEMRMAVGCFASFLPFAAIGSFCAILEQKLDVRKRMVLSAASLAVAVPLERMGYVVAQGGGAL